MTTNYPSGWANGVTVRGVPLLSAYPGRAVWVDSATGSNGNKGTFDRPFASIAYAALLANGKVRANKGDIIMVKAGSTDAVTAIAGLVLDTAGICIVFLGHGASRARITFGTAAGADMDVDAANITLVNPLFVSAVDALTGPIDVNAADFTIINGEYRDAAGLAAIDCIVADAAADRMTIDGWRFVDSTTGTQKQSNIQVAATDDIVLRNIDIVGDFGTGAIENGTAWVNAYLENVHINNLSATPTVAILLQATSTGSIKNTQLRVASGTTYLTANNDMQFYEVFGTGTDATTGEKVGTQLAGDIEAKIDVIDGYMDVPAADATTNATIRDAVGAKDDTTTQTIAATTSLMRYVKGILNAVAGTAGIATYPAAAAAADAVSISEVIRYISEYQVPRVVSKNIAAAGTSLTTGLSPVSLFTVTGNVKARVFAVNTTALASTANNGTLAIGVTGNTGGFIAATTMDGTNFPTNAVWAGDTSSTLLGEVLTNGSLNWVLLGNGVDIVATIATNSATAGEITFYCEYIPLNSSSTVVAA